MKNSLKDYNELIKREIEAVKKELNKLSNNPSGSTKENIITKNRSKFITISFKVDEEFFNKYLADIKPMQRSRFIRDAIVFYKAHAKDLVEKYYNSNSKSVKYNGNGVKKIFLLIDSSLN